MMNSPKKRATGSRPSTEALARIQEQLAARAREDLQSKRTAAEAARVRFEPYRQGLTNMFQHHGVPPDLIGGNSMKPRPDKVVRQLKPSKRLVRQKPRSEGALHFEDVPSSVNPFALWDWLQPQTGENAAFSASYGNNPAEGLLNLGIWAGGGSATGWGYVGNYYTGAELLGSYDGGSAQIILNPVTIGEYNYGVNNTNSAQLQVQLSILFAELDQSWNALDWQHWDYWNILDFNYYWPWQNGGNGIYFNTDDSASSYFLPLLQSAEGVPFSADKNYGIFLQLYCWAEASGGSWSWTDNMQTWLQGIALEGTGYGA
jgi:hypothetical protein